MNADAPSGAATHRCPHPLAVGQQNAFALFFLILNEGSYMFSQVIDCFV